MFSGFIDIPEEGAWQFRTVSDDGSALYIDGVCVVDNDGSHTPSPVDGRITLTKGIHSFRLLYFDDEGDQFLEWAWKSPSARTFAPVPANRLFHR